MAGGQGTRLRPLTCGVPKPLVKLCGRPVVYYILDLLDKHGFTEVTFTLGYKGEQIESLFETGRYKGLTLHFSREDSPLGTAGCVKQAARDFNDDFLVISGDALCDFDLSRTFTFHENMNTAATIITKRVDDPREYGLVLSDDTGRITGFSEKPSYLGCIDDLANTGVYILSPKVLELIPDNTACDFARDVFPRMLENSLKTKMPLYSYEESGYWCDIGDFSTYIRSQLDILKGRVRCRFDESRRIGTNFIGRGVTIGENSSVDSCIIGDNVNIGGNVKLKNAVILDSAFISNGATVNNAIVCQNAKLQHSASVFENSVIGEGAIIGREAIISNGARIWNDKHIKPGANITRDVKYGGLNADDSGGAGIGGISEARELSDSGVSGQTNIDVTPEFCAKLGAALATVAGGGNSAGSVAVACEANNASNAMKCAIMAGVSGAGAEVFDIGTATRPQLIYAANLLDCGIVARVKCGVFAKIEIMTTGGLGLSRPDERKLEAALTRSEHKNADWSAFGAIHSMSGLEDMYTAMLRSHSGFKSSYRIKINCNNASLTRLLTPVFGRVSNPDENSEILIITLTEGGTGAEFYTENDIKISYDK
jgi:mannose-1-phosphate guanylyltransferase/phosphomannomutase